MRLRPGIALALGAGAGLGWAHIGVLRALNEAGIRINACSGTSIGALAAVCAGAHQLDTLEGLARSANLRTVLRFIDPHWKSGAMLGGREIQRHLADSLDAALATPDGRAKLQDDPEGGGGDPFWTELFAGAPRLDGAW